MAGDNFGRGGEGGGREVAGASQLAKRLYPIVESLGSLLLTQCWSLRYSFTTCMMSFDTHSESQKAVMNEPELKSSLELKGAVILRPENVHSTTDASSIASFAGSGPLPVEEDKKSSKSREEMMDIVANEDAQV